MASTIGLYIERQLEKKGWTKKALAKRSKISHVTLAQVISGESQKSGKPFKITVDTLESIAKGLQVPVIELFLAYLGMEEDTSKQQEFDFDSGFQEVMAEYGKKLSELSEEVKSQIRQNVLDLNHKLLRASIAYELERLDRTK